MLDNILRDEETMPAVKHQFARLPRLRRHGPGDADGRPARAGSRRQQVLAATGHALAFTTWRSLAREQGLDDSDAAELMCRLVGAAADAPSAAKTRNRRR